MQPGDAATDPFGGVWMLLRGRQHGQWWLTYEPPGGGQEFLALTRQEGPGLPHKVTRDWARLARFADDLAALVAAVEREAQSPERTP